ncbi:MAG: GGDEF domain-containing protein [Coriobacteriia bacterium]|nr:GGDEF domain-containing protein [Coriobacteriia bacterium]
MSLRDRDVLYEYLRSILYDENPQPINLSELDPEYTKFGRALQFLDSSIQEMRTYAADLAAGNLSGAKPLEDNALTHSLIELEDKLRDITKKAQLAARGDYAQTMDWLPDFSDAFNSILRQIEELNERVKQSSDSAKRAGIEMNNHDSLTGTYNRRYLMDHLRTFHLAGWPGSLCMLDLDGLGRVNHEYSHKEGDEYLKRLVDLLQRSIRGSDTLARYGDDEFCLILPNCATAVANSKMESLLERFSTTAESPYPSSFSFGVVELGGSNADRSIDDLLKMADRALWENKQAAGVVQAAAQGA